MHLKPAGRGEAVGRGPRAAVSLAVVATALARGPTIVGAHGEAAAETGTVDPAVSFLAAIGLSATLGVAFGVATVSRARPSPALERGRDRDHDHDHGHGSTTRTWVTALLVALGVAALLSAGSQGWALAIGGGLVGGAVAWIGRTRGVSPHDGCADAAFGAVLTHRTLEGTIVAGVYAASAALGLLGLALLTVHAIAETVAIGGLYAPVSRGWGLASVLALQVAFVLGAAVGGQAVGFLSAAAVTALLAGVGGVLLVAGASEFRGVAIRSRGRHEA